MFKTILTAATIALSATLAHAADRPVNTAPNGVVPTQDLNAYCEWVTLYDVYGNWFTVWQCY